LIYFDFFCWRIEKNKNSKDINRTTLQRHINSGGVNMAANVTPVKLEVKDFAEREVISVDYKFTQETDIEGQITGIPRGGKVVIKVKAMNDGNNQLLQWMLAANDPRDMKISFENTVDGKTMKTIEGTGCYCVKYNETWEDGEEHVETIEVVCQTLKNGPVEFNNPWK